MLRQTSFLLIILTAVLSAGPESNLLAEVTWPGMLGPNRDGWVQGFEPPANWPEQLTRGWQVEVGSGYGSPLVSEGRVYQHARQGEDEVLWCLDLKTGDVKWRKSWPVPFKMGGGGERHGKGPKSSPVLADGRVFTMSITGYLTAWDADTGQLLWRRDYADKFEKSHPYWGTSTSPIVDGQRVVVHFGGDEQGALTALDVRTGKELWSLGDDGASYSSPLVVDLHGVRQVIEWNHNALVGVDSKSGRLLWQHAFPHAGTNQNMPTPAFHQGRVLLGGENRGIHSLEPQRDANVPDAPSVKKRWQQDKVALDMSSAVINGDRLFGFSHYGAGRFFCLNAESGEILWQGPGRAGNNAALLSIPGYIVALLDEGDLKIIAANDKRYEVAATYHVSDSPTWAPPVLLPGGLLVKDEETLTFWSFAPTAEK